MKLRSLALLVIVLVGVLTFGQQTIYFDVGMARQLGMGSTFTAVADEASCALWNPAGIAMLPQSQTSFSVAVSAEDAKLYSLTFASPPSGPGDFAGALTYWYGKKEIGDIEETDFVYSVAQKLAENFALGVNIRHKRPTVGGQGDSEWAIDIGLLTNVDPKITLGLSYLNLNAPSITLPGGALPLLPGRPTVNIGIALRPDEKTLFALDICNLTEERSGFPRDKVQVRGGLERVIGQNMVGRLGWMDKNGTMGLGMIYKGLKIDYGYLVARKDRNDLHLLSVTSMF